MTKITAAIIIIGNEILSGRTQDINVQYIASKLSNHGIFLEECRIIPDVKENIINTVNDLRSKYSYIFVTGGIGPTHDDITSDAIAACFNVQLVKNPEAYRRIQEYYQAKGRDLNNATIKMSYIPEGALLIDNNESAAPGFILENVYVMAGVPYIMQSMMEFILPQIKSEKAIESTSISLNLAESVIANEMEIIQNKYPDVSVGSYPFLSNNKPATSVVMRSNNVFKLTQAFDEFKEMVSNYTSTNH